MTTIDLSLALDEVRPSLAASVGSWTPYYRSGGALSEIMIWDFCACVQDGNPAYWSEEWAKAHAPAGRLIVPPQMLLTHSRFPPGPIGTAAEWEPPYVVAAMPVDPLQAVLRTLRERAGLDVYTNAFRHERYLAPLHPGDVLATSASIEISGVKRTWLGQGVFVNTRARYRRESDQVLVAESDNALFVYGTPDIAADRAAPKPSPKPSLLALRQGDARETSRRTSFDSLPLEQVQVGGPVPLLHLQPTFRDLMLAAQGTRHPVPMHTDGAYARAAGNRDAYFSTLWQAGILGRYVTDWSGPRATLKALSFTMVDNVCPGDDVTVAGAVVAVDGSVASLELEIATQLGLATKATCQVEWTGER